jgi:hypothetical protein
MWIVIPNIIFYTVVASSVGLVIYSRCVGIELWYDYLAFAPSNRRGWKRVPRPVIIIGVISGIAFVLAFVAGSLMALFSQ